MRSTLRRAAIAMIVAALGLATAAAAQSKMPKLPGPYTFAQAGDSPGTVTFNHTSHVGEAAPSCTTCHPKSFTILKAGATADGKPITHAAMDKGAFCGACHNAKKSFGIDDCTLCHRSS